MVTGGVLPVGCGLGLPVTAAHRYYRSVPKLNGGASAESLAAK
jgi:hypothetical protein